MSLLKHLIKGKPSAVTPPSTEVSPVDKMAVIADQISALADEMLAQINILKAEELQG